MVKLTLVASKGNAARAFPHAGFLALTPVKLEGTVHTTLDDDRKPLPAADLFVALRCYEARITRTGHTHTNLLVDHRVHLWSKPAHEQWADIADGEWPFRIVLPPTLSGHSSAHFQDYRVFWRIEAVLNHIPILGVGHRKVKTFDICLTRYDPGEALPPPDSAWCLAQSPKLPTSIRYLITSPPIPLGPMDLVPVSLKLIPADPAFRVHTLAVALERRLEFNDPVAEESAMTSTTALVERTRHSSHKPITFLVASTQVSNIPQDENGVHAKTVTLQIPMQKSSSHWAVGETMRTALVTIRFFLRVKVTLSHAHTGGLDTLELGERELCLVSTNESQRRLAMSKHAEAVQRARPHDSNRPSPPLTPLPTTPMTASSLHNKASPTSPGASMAKVKSARRPHTSAGPRDAAREAARGVPRKPSQNSRDVRVRPRTQLRPHTAEEEATPVEVPDVRVWEHELSEARSHWRTIAIGGGTAVRSGFVPAAADTVQAWEEELERIAAQSRRRSVEMLGFSERRTRPRIETTTPSPS